MARASERLKNLFDKPKGKQKPSKAPYVKKFPKIDDTLDKLDKYDPVDEADQFNAELSRIMQSTSTILREPDLDPRDLPHAPNYYEWSAGSQYLNYKPFARQVDIGLQLNLDVCPWCTPEFYEKDIDHKWHYTEMRSRFELFKYGVCPHCKRDRELGVRKGLIFDKTRHIGVAGQRSSKCLTGNTLINTPTGPLPIECLHTGMKVRLPNADVAVSAVRQKRELIYRVETEFGMPIEGTRNHRLLTDEGYLYLQNTPKMRPIRNWLVIPKVPRIYPETTPKDRQHRSRAQLDVAYYMAGRAFNINQVWTEPYAYKKEFFLTLLRRDILFDSSRFQFRVQDENAYVALRMWIEAHGVMTSLPKISVIGFGLTGNLFEVDHRPFLGLGWDFGLTQEQQRHYWSIGRPKMLPIPGKVLKPLAEALKLVMNNHDRFKMLMRKDSPVFQPTVDFRKHHGDPFNDKMLLKLGKAEEARELELYATFNICNKKSMLTRKRLQETLRKLRPWGELAWTTKERKDYDALIAMLREMLVTRYTKITKITQSRERKLVYDITVPTYHWFVANTYHSHNSVLTGHNIGYNQHRLIHTGDPAGYYNLLPGTVLSTLLTATGVTQAEKNLFRPIANMMTQLPWWKTYAKWAAERSARLGIELFRIKDTFIFIRASGLEIRVVAPDKSRSRGFTTTGIGIDELGWFDSDENKKLASGPEMWTALVNSMLTVQAAAINLRKMGEIDVPFPIAHAVSSPFSHTDPIMTLRKEHKNDDETLTYMFPTWKFNPLITPEFCQKLSPHSWKRDFGCELSTATGTFITQSAVLESLCSETRNAIKVMPTIIKHKRNGGKFTIGELSFKWKPREGDNIVTGLALDAGEKRNSYAFCVFHIEDTNDADEVDALEDEDETDNIDTSHIGKADADVDYEDEDEIDEDEIDEDEDEDDEDESLDNYRLVIDAIGEVQPSVTAPIHFTKMIEEVLYPIIEAFKVKVVVSDRWQVLQMQQDLEDDFDINASFMTPKLVDFHALREAVNDQTVILPRLEMDIRDVIDLPHPSDFVGMPVAHLVKQFLTVKEGPKTVDKGINFSDDLFRTIVLAHMCLRDDEMRDALLSDMSPEPEGLVSLAAGINTDFAKPENRTAMSMVMFGSPGRKPLVSNPDDDSDDKTDAKSDAKKQAPPASFSPVSPRR